MFQQLLEAPQNQVCKCLYMSLILAMGRKSVVIRAFFVFGSIWNIVLFQNDRMSPVYKKWYMMPRRAVTTLSGAKCNNSATNPLSSEVLFIISRLMAPFNSCVSSNSVLSSAMVGLDYLDVHEKYFLAEGCPPCRTIVCDIFCSIFHWFGIFSGC